MGLAENLLQKNHHQIPASLKVFFPFHLVHCFGPKPYRVNVSFCQREIYIYSKLAAVQGDGSGVSRHFTDRSALFVLWYSARLFECLYVINLCVFPVSQADVLVASFFCTQDQGLLLHDCYPRPAGTEALLALDVPFYYFTCKVGPIAPPPSGVLTLPCITYTCTSLFQPQSLHPFCFFQFSFLL